MKTSVASAFCYLSVTLLVISFAARADDHEPISLIDGSLSQFHNVYEYGEATVENGVISLTSTGNFFLMTKREYADFILELEVKMPEVDEYSNAGIIFRAQLKGALGSQRAVGYQAEVDPSERKWSGGLYDQDRRDWLHPTHPTRSHPDHHFVRNLSGEWNQQKGNAYKANEWNKYRIECRGSNIKIYLNDVLTTHVIDTTDAKGFIGLQHHGSKKLAETGETDNIVQFRGVTIKELNR